MTSFNLQQLSLHQKLGLGGIAFLAVLLGIGAIGLWGVGQTARRYGEAQQLLTAGRSVVQADRARERIRFRVSQVLMMAETKNTVSHDESLQDLRQELRRLAKRLQGSLDALAHGNLLPVGQLPVEQLSETAQAFCSQAENILTLALAGQQIPRHTEIFAFQDSFDSLGKDLAALESTLAEQDQAIQLLSAEARASGKQWLLWSLLGGFGLSLVIVWMLGKSITQPLRAVTEVVTAIASGNTHVQLEYRGEDEIGKLAGALQDLRSYLQGLERVAACINTGDVSVRLPMRSEHDSLSKHMMQLLAAQRSRQASLDTGSAALSAAIRQMSASLSQLSVSTSEMAASISQTAATVEQVRQTAQVSALKAKEVASHSQQAAVISQSGEQSVEEARSGLLGMRAHVESIARSVATLDQQSQAISEIIMTVNDMAEQSHVLAVNAAIEAAKAGESGRGFGVVAQEMKTLAEQSQQATTQVYGILHDVQQAVGAAMDATEKGTAAVEMGVRKSMGVGELLQVLSQNIAETGQAVTQIATNSEQQLLGVDQMVLAVDNMKQASSHHGDGLRLIERVVEHARQVETTFQQLMAQLTDRGAEAAPSMSVADENTRSNHGTHI